MRLTTRSRYGTRMLLDIALHGSDGPVRIGDIASRQKLSLKYLEKLIRELKRAGYIKSKRGPKGGHMLAVSAEDIRVGDVVRVLEGDPSLVECGEDASVCPRSADCPTREVWLKASQAMYATLDAVTIADLLSAGPHCLT